MFCRIFRWTIKFQRSICKQEILAEETVILTRPSPITVEISSHTEHPRKQKPETSSFFCDIRPIKRKDEYET